MYFLPIVTTGQLKDLKLQTKLLMGIFNIFFIQIQGCVFCFVLNFHFLFAEMFRWIYCKISGFIRQEHVCNSISAGITGA